MRLSEHKTGHHPAWSNEMWKPQEHRRHTEQTKTGGKEARVDRLHI